MPQFFLKINAELENVRSLVPAAGNLWKFDIQTPGGGEVRKGITVSIDDVYPLEGSRGEANFIIKWPYASDQSYLRILPHKEVKSAYRAEDSGQFVTILAMECRGLEPVAWHPGMDFDVVAAEGGALWRCDLVDLSERDWAEYDAEHDQNIQIFNLDYRIEQHP